jgi:hypothetical protein
MAVINYIDANEFLQTKDRGLIVSVKEFEAGKEIIRKN